MGRVVPRLALLALGVFALSVGAASSRILFPNSLHLTRQIHDPLSGGTVVIDEYCSGNRMVAISGQKTVVVDYEKQEITEIDRRAGTYSVSRFAEVASAVAEAKEASMTQTIASDRAAAASRKWNVTPLGVRGSSGRSVEQFEFIDGEARGRRVDVGIDRSVALTREAVEVLIGAAYPNPVRDEHEPVLRAASARGDHRAITTNDVGAADGEPTYGLPVTQAFTYSESGAEVTFSTTITRVGSETVPADALIIPPSSKRVESPAAVVRRELRDLDHPASMSAPRGN